MVEENEALIGDDRKITRGCRRSSPLDREVSFDALLYGSWLDGDLVTTVVSLHSSRQVAVTIPTISVQLLGSISHSIDLVDRR